MISGECRVETRGPDGRAVQLEGLRLRLDLRFVRRSSSETADGGTETLLQVEAAELLARQGHQPFYQRWTLWVGAAALLLVLGVGLILAFVSGAGSAPAQNPLEHPKASPAAPVVGAPGSMPHSEAGLGRASGPSQAPERNLDPLITQGAKDAAPPSLPPASPATPSATEGPTPRSSAPLNLAGSTTASRPTSRSTVAHPAAPSRPRARGVPAETQEPPSRRAEPSAAAAARVTSGRPEPRTSSSRPPAAPAVTASASAAGYPMVRGAPGPLGRHAPSADRLDLFDDTQ